MPTENNPAPFRREDRYIVIKRSDMEKLPADTRRNFQGRCRNFYEQMLIAGAPARSFLVLESDWPEYEPAWQMIERRMAGQPAVTAAEELDAVLHWRGKHAQAIRERDALQQRLTQAEEESDSAKHYASECLTAQSDAEQRLTAADQRIDELTGASADRSPKDYAIEHAEYMARSADDVLAKKHWHCVRTRHASPGRCGTPNCPWSEPRRLSSTSVALKWKARYRRRP